MDLGINGKTALVTGAGRGLGEAICHTLAAEGVRIVGCARTKTDLKELQNSLRGKGHLMYAFDLQNEEECDSLISRVRSDVGCPEIIVNNVGGNLNYSDPLGPLSEWHEVMRLNVETAVQINGAFIPDMQSRKWGRICHISSISALENQGPPSYCAAKLALNAYVRSLGRYVSPDNVILTSVMPGAVFTEGGYWDMTAKMRPEHVEKYLRERMAIQRFGTVEEISGAVAFLCSDHASFCVGSCLLIDGGQGRVFHQGDAV